VRCASVCTAVALALPPLRLGSACPSSLIARYVLNTAAEAAQEARAREALFEAAT